MRPAPPYPSTTTSAAASTEAPDAPAPSPPSAVEPVPPAPAVESTPPDASQDGAPTAPTPESPFPIVGIGASAGGLEALDQFLRNVPGDYDAAFVIVQHHDPAHGHMLVEVLRRMTQLEVVEAADGTRPSPCPSLP